MDAIFGVMRMRGFQWFFVLMGLFGGAGTTAPAGAAPSVQIIYLVPADRKVSETYRTAVEVGVRHFQGWLSEQLKGSTFRLADPPVRVVKSEKNAVWFRSAERHTGYAAFYANTVDELTRMGVARRDDPALRFLVYVDADHACGQSGAGGNGIAVVTANDLRGLAGERIVPACEKANGAEVPVPCRWVGGIGHEFLHTIGLSHPDRSPSCQTTQCRAEALMMQGYVSYPRAILLEEEKAQVLRSPFIGAGLRTSAGVCAADGVPTASRSAH